MDTEPLLSADALLDLEVPEECLPGVRANLALLAEHLRNLEGFVVPEADEA
jgi:hypothetical protein